MSQTRKNPYSITSSPAITQCTTIESVVSRSPITCVAFDRVQVRIPTFLSLSLHRPSRRRKRKHVTGIALDRYVGRMDYIDIVSEYDEIFIFLFEI